MSRGVLSALLVMASGLAAIAAPAEAVIAAGCPGPRELGQTGVRRFAATFTPAFSGNVTAARFEISNNAPLDDFVIAIRDSAGGAPGPNVLASAPLPDQPAAGATAKGLDGVFASPAHLSAGQTYAATIEIGQGQAYITSSRTANPCPDTAGFADPLATGAFTPFVGGVDLVYSVFMNPDPASPPPAPAPAPAPAEAPVVVVAAPAIDRTAPVFTLTPGKGASKRADLLKKGVQLTLTPSEPASFQVDLVGRLKGTKIASAGDVTLASASLPVGTGARSVTLKLSSKLKRALGKKIRPQLRVVAVDVAGNRATKQLSLNPK